jgi:hypothetical protein
VCTEAQHIPDRRIEPVEWPVQARIKHGVVRPESPQRAVHQLSGKRGVPPVEPAVAKQARQDEIGVRVPLVYSA